jgi:hypothetical protein
MPDPMQAFYVYAIGEALRPDMLGREVEGVDGRTAFTGVDADGLIAFCSIVDGEKFSQDEIDRHAADLAWLGDIGFHHQNVISALARKATVIPLRAFTLFASEASLRQYLQSEKKSLETILQKLRGKDEWTLRLELEPDPWSAALVRRVPALRKLTEELETTSAGRGYLLRKKIDEERKKAARTAEEDLLREIEQEVAKRFSVPTLVENREQRSGSFPQISLLLERTRAGELRNMQQELASKYRGDGVNVVLTGPWPPYSFATERG